MCGADIRLGFGSKMTSFRSIRRGQDREKGTAITPYHDHVWSLRSCVLYGAIENVLLELEEAIDGEYQVADINQVGNVDDVVPAFARVRLKVQSRQTYRAGDFYE